MPGSSGSMPPCMQTSVAPSSHASCGPVGDLVQRQRVGVGVGAPLGERAEPAADVADVGEVDVAVDDVGHLVADGVAAQVVGQPAHLLEQRRPRRSSGSAPARRRGAAGRPRPRAAPPSPSPAWSRRSGRASSRPRPSAADCLLRARPSRRRRCRSRRAGPSVRPSVSMAGVQVGTTPALAVRLEAAVGLLPRQAGGSYAGAGQAVAVRRARRRGPRRAGRATARPARTYSGCTVSRGRSSKPGLGGDRAQPLQRGPRAARG